MTQASAQEQTGDVWSDVSEHRLERPDGRTVAWTETGPGAGPHGDGVPLLRIPGTPGSRWTVRADRTPWRERRIHALTTERPGCGASTRLPGRAFSEHSDDLAAILDERGLDRVHVFGGSGAAPHILSFCARHPDRVLAATVLVGISPLEPDEVDQMIGLNQASWRACAAGDREALIAALAPVRDQVLADPLAALRQIMDTAPDSDKAVMEEPGWQAVLVRGMREALGQGVDGWADEAYAINQRWDDIDLAGVTTSVTWYHAEGDRNCPLSAAKRLVGRLPHARLVEWPTDGGHLYGYHHEAEILDELLARG